MGDGTLRKYEITDQNYGQSYPREAVFADFNQDGRIDVLVVGHGYDMPDTVEKGFEDRHLLYLSNNDYLQNKYLNNYTKQRIDLYNNWYIQNYNQKNNL